MSDPIILAVDAGGTSLKAALAGEDGGLLPGCFFRQEVNSDGTAEELAASYRALARKARQEARSRSAEITAVSVCIPGPFQYRDGVCLMRHKYAAIYGIPMRPWFEEGLGAQIPIHFLHDSTAFLLGAARNLDRNRYKRICGAIIGTGLGFASMFDGKIYENPQGGPGISIFSRPFRDSIAEDYVSKRAVEREYQMLCPGEPLPTVEEIASMAREGHEIPLRIFQDLGTALGEILRDICAENRFELLLLGGAISKSADLFIPALRKAMAGPWIPEIRQAGNLDSAPLLGAAQAALLNQE